MPVGLGSGESEVAGSETYLQLRTVSGTAAVFFIGGLNSSDSFYNHVAPLMDKFPRINMEFGTQAVKPQSARLNKTLVMISANS